MMGGESEDYGKPEEKGVCSHCSSKVINYVKKDLDLLICFSCLMKIDRLVNKFEKSPTIGIKIIEKEI